MELLGWKSMIRKGRGYSTAGWNLTERAAAHSRKE
jgi:hypothetical protein